MRSGRLPDTEPEFARLGEWVRGGDWVVDIGANYGYYSLRLSDLVGPSGHVLALEPVPETFEVLVSNMSLCRHRNVTLLNVAASEGCAAAWMKVPKWPSGLPNYYQAECVDESAGEFQVLALAVDAFALPTVRLIKLDVEGHEAAAIRGMMKLIERDRPVLIVEGRSEEVRRLLDGYRQEYEPGSPNCVYLPG